MATSISGKKETLRKLFAKDFLYLAFTAAKAGDTELKPNKTALIYLRRIKRSDNLIFITTCMILVGILPKISGLF